MTFSAPDQIRDDPIDHWARFTQPGTSGEFVAAWFGVLCGRIDGLERAVLLLETTDGRFGTAARWPGSGSAAAKGDDADPLLDSCNSAISTGAVDLRAIGDRRALGFPVRVAGRVQSVLGLVLAKDRDVAAALRDLQWGSGWIHGLIAEREADTQAARSGDVAAAVAVLATLEDGATLEAALRALTNEIQIVLHAGRVAVALLNGQGRRLRMRAFSQTADIERKSGVVRSLVQAMEEARMQIRPVVYPAPPGAQAVSILAAHRAHAARSGATGMISVPLAVRGKIIGMIAAERMADVAGSGDGSFDAREVTRFEAIAGLTAPLIDMKRQQDRLLSGKGLRWIGQGFGMVFGRRHPGLKLLLLTLAGCTVWLTTAQTALRASAPARIEGAVQRVAVAPFDGYVQTAPHRAGDTVKQGDVLATLDDRDLKLDLLKQQSERARLVQESDAARAKGNRAALATLAAQITRTQADIDIARTRLARIDIRAPFDGLVIEGDLSQRLGAPVREGEELFRIASGDDFRVTIEIGEYDIRLVRQGTLGTLVLSGIAATTLPVEVTRIAEVAAPDGSRNAFRAEARLTDPPQQLPDGLRPGLEGVVKLSGGRASIGYALLRPVIDRTRMLLWSWTP